MLRRVDDRAQTFGLPSSLRIPVAAKDTDSIEEFVGSIVAEVKTRGRPVRTNAVKVKTPGQPRYPKSVPLWQHASAAQFKATLYPKFQLWVHVDYSGYRRAWSQLGMPKIVGTQFLDHIANRKATRSRGYLHPYIRLCPISRKTNTNAGHRCGAEGLECEYMNNVKALPKGQREALIDAMRSRVVYADPSDITKMLDDAPGTFVLDGVRDSLRLLYPAVPD